MEQRNDVKKYTDSYFMMGHCFLYKCFRKSDFYVWVIKTVLKLTDLQLTEKTSEFNV